MTAALSLAGRAGCFRNPHGSAEAFILVARF